MLSDPHLTYAKASRSPKKAAEALGIAQPEPTCVFCITCKGRALKTEQRIPRLTQAARNEVAKKLRGSSMPGPTSEFDRDEMVVCMIIAFCLGNAALKGNYGLMT
jgi:hypothetical protein